MGIGLLFDGVHSDDLNLMITDISRPLFHDLKDEYIDIPHKDGSVLIPDNSRKDVNVSVTIKLIPTTKNIMNEARNVGNWLYKEERKPLIFDDDPDYVYGAKVSNMIELDHIVYHGEFTVMFRCLPYSIA